MLACDSLTFSTLVSLSHDLDYYTLGHGKRTSARLTIRPIPLRRPHLGMQVLRYGSSRHTSSRQTETVITVPSALADPIPPHA